MYKICILGFLAKLLEKMSYDVANGWTDNIPSAFLGKLSRVLTCELVL